MKKSFKKLFLLIAVVMTAMMCLALSASAETWGDYAYYSDYETGNIVLSKYNGSATSVTIPSKINGKPVVELSGTFHENGKIKSVTIPNSVTSISDFAFYDCDALTSITIPSSVKTIGSWAFSVCDALTSVTIPNGVTSIGDYAFDSCDALSKVTIGKNVKTIGYSAFSGCRKLEEITVPASVKSIGEHAFEQHGEDGYFSTVLLCPKGSYASKWAKKAGQPYVISNPSGNENIVKGRIGKFNWSVNKLTGELKLSGSGKLNYFSNTSAPWYQYRYYIKSISLPSGLTEIGENSFEWLYRVRSLKIPGTVKIIGREAFVVCENLKSVVFNKGLTTIEEDAFALCHKLESITLPNTVTSIGEGAFRDCESLKAVTIPNSVTYIGFCAFARCASLTTITIPNSVTRFGSGVFAGCTSLTTITIPSSVKSTSSSLFSGCTNLKKVVLEKGVESIYEDTFDDSNENLEIVVKNKNCSFSSDCGLNYNHTIWGYKGSTAEAYADEIGARFIDINHKHVYKNKTTKATLTQNGKITPTCKICGNTTKATTIYYPKSIKLSATSFTYNGKAISPAVTVKDSKGNVLKKGTDYTVVYSSGRTNPGSYVAKVTFKGKYSGVQRITFTIKPSTPAITAVASTAKSRVAVAWKNVVGETGYQVYYSTKKDSGYKAFMTSKADVVKVAKNGLASGKTYYFKVRAYKTVSGTSIYSDWSAAAAVKIK